MDDIKLFLDQLSSANEKYLEAEAYFRGAPPEIFSNLRIKEHLGIETGQFKKNYSSIPVEAMASRMAINGFYVSDSDVASEFISELWMDSKMHVEFPGFVRDLCKYGEGYIELGLTEDGEVDICIAPVIMSQMVYWAGDLRVKLFFGKLSFVAANTEGEVLRVVTLKYSDRTERWIETAPDSDVFEPDLTELEEGEYGWEMHEFGEVPAFHFRNETPFGMPEHYQAYGAQDQIVKIVMNEMGVIDFAGLPQRWFINQSGTPNGTANFGEPGVESSDSVGFGVNPNANKGPGSMLLFPNGGSTGSYDAGDVNQFISAEESALRSMAVLTNTPIRFFSDPGGQHPSGESLRASDARFKAKILNREDSYGMTLGEVFRLALEVAGYDNVAQPTVKWQPQAVDDSVDALEIAEKKVNLGIPKYYVLLELGYTEDVVASWGYDPTDKPEPNSINPTSTRD